MPQTHRIATHADTATATSKSNFCCQVSKFTELSFPNSIKAKKLTAGHDLDV